MIVKAFCLILSLIPFLLFSSSARADEAKALREIADSVTIKILECRRNPVARDRIGEPIEDNNDHLEGDNSKLCFDNESSFKQVGSGTIIASQGNTYYVLTARHVVSSIQSTPYVAISSKTTESIQLSLVRDKMGLPLIWESDMALLSFNTDEYLSPATLYTGCVIEEWSQLSIPVEGAFPFSMLCQSLEQLLKVQKTATEMPQILVSGYPLSQEEDAQTLLSLGTFIDRNSKSLNLQTPVAGGYEFLYDAVTEKGMSGGAILDTDGRLIGIHGVTDGEPVSGLSFGYGLGIPIDYFLRELVLALSTDYDLDFVTLKTTDLLPQEGQGLVIVANIDGLYHIRVFDRNGRISINRDQRSFANDLAFIRKLDSSFSNQSLGKQSRDELLREIAASLGYAPSTRRLSGIEFLSDSSTPSGLSSKAVSTLLGGEVSDCLLGNVAVDGDMLMEYGSRLVRLGRYYEALNCFERASLIRTDSPLPLYGMGMIFLRLATHDERSDSKRENLARAKTLLKDAINISDSTILSSRQIYIFKYNLGQVLNQLRDYEEAIQVFDQAIIDYRAAVGESSEYSQAWAAKAIALNELGRAEEASSAQLIAGSESTGYSGIVSRANGLYESAIQKIQEGESLTAMQMLHEADTTFDRAQDFRSPSTSLSEIWLGKAKVQTALGNYGEAKISLSKSVEDDNEYSFEILDIVFEIASSNPEESFEWGQEKIRRALEDNENNYAALYFNGLFFSIDSSIKSHLFRYESAYNSCKKAALINESFQPAVECYTRMQFIVEDIKILEEKCEARAREGGFFFGWLFGVGYNRTDDSGGKTSPGSLTDGTEISTRPLGRVSSSSGSSAHCRETRTRRIETSSSIGGNRNTLLVNLNLVRESN